MAADAAGNDLLNVFIPVTGFLAFAQYGTALPSASDMAVYGYVPPVGSWTRAGLITVDSGFGWSDERASAIEFFQDGYQTNAGNGTAKLAVKLAETSANVRKMLRGVAPGSSGEIDVDVDADVHWALYTEEVDKNGNIRRIAAGNCWLETSAKDRSTRGEINANEATFTVKRDSGISNKHYREVIVPATAAPAPFIASILPSGKAAGADVLVQGTYMESDIASFKMDNIDVIAYTRVSSQLVIATIPTGVSAGSTDVILTTTSGGASNTYVYTAA